MSCLVSLFIILSVLIKSVILISVVRLVWGRCREASRQKYVRRRERQNVTVGGQPAAPLQTFRSEVLVVEVLGHFLQVLHVGSVGWLKQNLTMSLTEVLSKELLLGGCKPSFFYPFSVITFELKTNLLIFLGRLRCSLSLTSALSAVSGSHYAPGSPPPRLPRGTDGPSPSSPWPRSVGWIPPLRMGYWSEKNGLRHVKQMFRTIPSISN